MVLVFDRMGWIRKRAIIPADDINDPKVVIFGRSRSRRSQTSSTL
jgi:hypothetical protein